jgi:hypothetical protein
MAKIQEEAKQKAKKKKNEKKHNESLEHSSKKEGTSGKKPSDFATPNICLDLSMPFTKGSASRVETEKESTQKFQSSIGNLISSKETPITEPSI